MCHTRTSELPHVANTSLYPSGNATSLIASPWHVWISSDNTPSTGEYLR